MTSSKIKLKQKSNSTKTSYISPVDTAIGKERNSPEQIMQECQSSYQKLCGDCGFRTCRFYGK